MLIKHFPFLIIYRIDEAKKKIVIVSIFHAKRNPKGKTSK
jgi:plasmid stabilization system protein ParE